jgi:exosortase
VTVESKQATVEPQTPSRSNDLKWFLGLALVLFITYIPVLTELVQRWYNDDNYSHGFLVPLVSAYLLWRKKDELSQLRRSVNWWGAVAIFAGMALFLVGNAGSEYFTVRVSMVVTLFGLVWLNFGNQIVRRTWFEMFLLLFMIPIPAVVYFSATFPMQLFASKVTVFLLDGLGMPVFRQGNIIHLPDQSLEVAEACSGLRSLISLLAMGAIYGYVTQPRFWAQALLFFSTIPIAVATNVVRVFVTTMLTYAFGIDTTQEPTHSIMGASVFIVAFIMLFIFGAILRRFQR